MPRVLESHYNRYKQILCFNYRHSGNGTGIYNPYLSDISIVEGHHRYKRGFWDGIEFKLSTPSVDWQKKTGTRALGASFGVILENYLDIKIGKLSVEDHSEGVP